MLEYKELCSSSSLSNFPQHLHQEIPILRNISLLSFSITTYLSINMTSIETFLERNKTSAADHKAYPLISEFAGVGVEFPHTLVLTCADPRCIPESFLGLKFGDGVVVLRNAGGHVTPEITSILALDNLLGIKDLLVIHHTDCGTLFYKNDQVKEVIKSRVHTSHHAAIDNMEFGAITDIKQSVLDDLNALKANELVRKEIKDGSRGFVFDIQTGLLEEVKA